MAQDGTLAPGRYLFGEQLLLPEDERPRLGVIEQLLESQIGQRTPARESLTSSLATANTRDTARPYHRKNN